MMIPRVHSLPSPPRNEALAWEASLCQTMPFQRLESLLLEEITFLNETSAISFAS
jgi:hypothetical protein